MVDIPTGPLLSEQHLQQINDGIKALEVVKGHIAQAKRANIDVAAAEQKANEALDKLNLLKTVYFPNR